MGRPTPASLANLTGGSRKGIPNKVTSDLKAMVLEALDNAGGAAYLLERAQDPATMGAFLSLIGKCLPKDVNVDANVSWLDLLTAAAERDRARAKEGVPN